MKTADKRFAAAAATFAMLLAMSGCVGINFGPQRYANRVQATGPLVPYEYTVDPYTKVDLRGSYEVFYSSTVSDIVTLEIQENIAEFTSVTVEGGTLRVHSDYDYFVSNSTMPRLYIGTSTLEQLYVSGAIELDSSSDTIRGDRFTLNVSGACKARIDIEVDDLDASVSGAGNMGFTGTANTAKLSISGAGEADALNLITNDATVKISGAGEASITCNENLDVRISGAGSLRYRGSPHISQNISGAGSIRQID